MSEVKEEKKGVFAFRVVWGDAEFATTPETSTPSSEKSKLDSNPTALDTMLSDNTDDTAVMNT